MNLGEYIAVAEREDARLRRIEQAAEAKRIADLNFQFLSAREFAVAIMPELAEWDACNPGERTGGYGRYDDWPTVIFEQTFGPEGIVIRLGTRRHGDALTLHTNRPQFGWEMFAGGGSQWIASTWSSEDRMTMLSLAVRQAADFAIQERERASRPQPAEVAEPEVKHVHHHEWHAVLSRRCAECEAVEVESPVFDAAG